MIKNYNPIKENITNYKKKPNFSPPSENIVEVGTAVTAEWDNITQKKIKNLITGMS